MQRRPSTPHESQAAALAQRAYRRVCTILGNEPDLQRLGDDSLVVQVWGLALSRAFASLSGNLRGFVAPDVPLRRFAGDLLKEFRPMVKEIVDRSGGVLEWQGHGLAPAYRLRAVKASGETLRLVHDLANRIQLRIMKVLGDEMLEEVVKLEDTHLVVRVWLSTLGSAFAQVILITKGGLVQTDLEALVDAAISDFETRVDFAVEELEGR